ncbi:hypothetical protein ACFOOL_14915 [Devosia honganensis]|uniref:Uncharacterized protein n=1 Tax=Devosia honganensis TaxID=1610527 RepID=A0ABV7X4A0_9HYPH
MITVQLPNGDLAQFPDGMPTEEIEAVLQRQFGSVDASGQAAPPDGLQPGTREYADWAAQQARAGATLPEVGRHQTTESSILDPFVQGATFGWGDELRGAVQGGIAAAQGGDFGSVYDQVVDESRNALDRERRVNPVGSVAAEIAGAIPTGIAAGGQLAGRGASLGARALSTGAVGLGQGAAYGAGASGDDQRGQGALVGGLTGGAVGAAVPLAGNAISNMIQKSQQGRILDAAAKVAPTADDLRSAASNLFEQATGGTPLAINDNAYMRLLGDVQQFGQKLRINPNLDQKSIGLWEMMRSIADDVAQGGVVIDMKDMHLLRQAAQRVAMSSEGRDAAFANTVINKLDDFVQTLKPADILGGADPSQAAKALYSGISTWSRANKVGLIEEAIRIGQSQAAGPEKGIRNTLRRMIFNKPDIWRRFNAAEQQAIREVIDGTPGSNLMKLIGTFGFGGNTATNGIGGAAGMALGQMAAGPVGMVAGPVLGSIGRNASERMTEGLAQRAMGAAATEGLKVLPRVNPNQATPIEVLLRKAALPNVGGLVSPR